MPKEYKRNQRVGELIQRELSDIIRRDINDASLGMITVASVDVSPDLKSAKVYVSLLANKREPAEVVTLLNQAASGLRHELAQRLTTRVTPKLHFLHDGSVEYAIQLSQLIDSVLPADDTSPTDDEHDIKPAT
ncbi:30S ribosome-binding factor RbfA [Beggiatoa leptomitoformis]|uniref:Ribosome-binding factor A n=1 Tax=Beggiatoa leptomitoformis TaxID=288004 RepID=A0A2N9YDP2_9GAMM|nr:30S ribosome-binding factor RbfA [Beggiatoa leptomitoformis]ALG69002.1 30S ribosome-binding factor RbfA [Beggiatoa leptomitoformis]AUI68603.1 30S ribosome-binding factor RbfA [Beggiatoa leptomitoformis]